MELTAKEHSEDESLWGGDKQPFKVTYGKMMMWFFIVSDALTFSGFLVAYSFSRFKNIDSWPIADEVFNHFPFLHGINAPMYFNDIHINFLVCHDGPCCRRRSSHEAI